LSLQLQSFSAAPIFRHLPLQSIIIASPMFIRRFTTW
jgi:hypothetical protein